MPEVAAHPLVLYDGVCGLCNRLTQFLLKRDEHDRLRFASLQSHCARSLLRRHKLDPRDLDTVYVVLDHGEPSEQLLARADAIILLMREIGGIWKLAGLGKLLPKFIRDALYNLVATNRYRVFGKYETCMLPEEKHRKKFLDQ